MNFGLYMVRITSWSTARAGGREGEGRRRVWKWVVGRGWRQGSAERSRAATGRERRCEACPGARGGRAIPVVRVVVRTAL